METAPKKYVRIEISPELYTQLKQFGAKTGRTVPKFAHQILKGYVENLNNDPKAKAKLNLTSLTKIPWPAADEWET